VARASLASFLLSATFAAAASDRGATLDPGYGPLSGVDASPGSTGLGSSQSDVAWWTGSLLSASAETLTVGHWLIEPDLTNPTVESAFDSHGHLHHRSSVERASTSAYMLYGLADGVSVGAIPRVQLGEHAAVDSGRGIGDLTTMLEIRLRARDPGKWLPAVALEIAETFPTGKFDRLSGSPDEASGAGVYRTDLALYAQSLLQVPGGHPLRMRVDLTYSSFDTAAVFDVSSYGTPAGFRGHVHPGPGIAADTAFELSLSLRWVLALDVLYSHQRSVSVYGSVVPPLGSRAVTQPLAFASGPSASWTIAPAVEYNFNSRVGVIAGVEVTTAGRNVAAERIPAVALNMYF
jgi:hypothetical protein